MKSTIADDRATKPAAPVPNRKMGEAIRTAELRKSTTPAKSRTKRHPEKRSETSKVQRSLPARQQT